MRLSLSSFVFLVAATGAAHGVEPPPPVAVFAALDGTWEGIFAGYDTEVASFTASVPATLIAPSTPSARPPRSKTTWRMSR